MYLKLLTHNKKAFVSGHICTLQSSAITQPKTAIMFNEHYIVQTYLKSISYNTVHLYYNHVS